MSWLFDTLIGAGALALPLTASIVYAAADPAAPAAPAAPHAPDVPKVVKKVIVIQHNDGEHGDDDKLVTRTIERDGTTIVIKSDHPISEAELEAKLARIDVDIPDLPDLPDIPVVRVIEDKDGKKIERRVIVRHGDGGGPRVIALGDRDLACADAAVREVSAATDQDGKKERVRMRFCHAAAAESHALEAMKKARDSIGRNHGLSDEIRAKVLEELDREIENMSKPG